MATGKAGGVYRIIGSMRGTTLLEYALLAALASVAAFTALLAVLGPKT